MIAGHATHEGTSRYRNRFGALAQADHFRQPATPTPGEQLWFSSIGLGTYLGETSQQADQAYIEAVIEALRSGVNLLDTAINYRYQRSERNIGAALWRLFDAGEIRRDEVIVCTKAGFLTTDADVQGDPRDYTQRELLDPGVVKPSEIVGGMHSMAPKFLEDQIERSKRNVGLKAIDVFYLHNPETQLSHVSQEEFYNRLALAFEACERKVKDGSIRSYGIATWNGLRVAPGERDYLDLHRVLESARAVGGEQHHFRFIQLPFNLAMPEAFVLRNQGAAHQHVSALYAAAEARVACIGSATLFQTRIFGHIPQWLASKIALGSDAENCIQFARSAPGIITALVGMGMPEHVRANLRIAQVPPMREDEWTGLFVQNA